MIKDSIWEEVVFPKPKSPEDIAFSKYVDKVADHYYEQTGTLEAICNHVLFDGDFSEIAKERMKYEMKKAKR